MSKELNTSEKLAIILAVKTQADAGALIGMSSPTISRRMKLKPKDREAKWTLAQAAKIDKVYNKVKEQFK